MPWHNARVQCPSARCKGLDLLAVIEEFLFRVTLRRLDLAAEIYHLREPQKIPLVMSPDETKRLLAVASSLKPRILLGLGYGCGLRASEVVRLHVVDDCGMNFRFRLMADANATLSVGHRYHLTQHRSAVISPALIIDHRAADQWNAPWQILVLRVPRAFDVADGDVLPFGTRQTPHICRANPLRR